MVGSCSTTELPQPPSVSKMGAWIISFFLGINSPQALKKILSLSEEGSLERHRKQAEDTISNASSQLSSPPTSPQSSPRKGRAQWLLPLLKSTHLVQLIPEPYTYRSFGFVDKYFWIPGSGFVCWWNEPNWDKLKSKRLGLIWAIDSLVVWEGGGEQERNHMAGLWTGA